MAATDALFTAGLVVSAPDARLGQAAAWPKNGLTPIAGVVYAGTTDLLTATATMQVTVGALHFVGSKDAQQGVYVGANDGPVALTIAAAPGSGSRTDKVYIMQQDSNPGTTSPDASTAPLIAATSGALPAGAVLIGTVTVPAGITKLTDAGVVIATTCRWVAAAGAPLPVRSAAERDALTAYTGMRVLRLDLGGLTDTHDGTAWRSQAWQDFTPTLFHQMTTTPTVIGTDVTYGRYRYLDPHTVQAQAAVARQAGSTTTGGLGIALPVTASLRSLNCGTLVAGDNSLTTQSSVALMSGDRTKLILTDMVATYLNVAPLTVVRYAVTYEV